MLFSVVKNAETNGWWNNMDSIPRKYNWDEVWKRHLETGYDAWRLSKLFNIPVSTISVILNHYKKK